MATAELIVEREQAFAQTWTLPAQIPELDGVRGLAVLLVMICHSAMWLPNGWLRSVLVEGRIGVDLFFVLSGFLITGILLDTQRDRRALRNFYIRRGLRIWPLYFGFLALAFIGLRRMVPTGLSPWAYLLFAQNFFYFANTGPLLDPTWSLAVEEQFYLLWPWIALRTRRETVFKICCAVLVLEPVVRCTFRIAGASETFIYANTLCRVDGIAMGGMLAAWVRAEGFDVAWLRRFARLALPLGAAGAALCYGLGASVRFATEIRFSFVALVFGGVLALALLVKGTGSAVAASLRGFGLSGMGRISYALYLFNLPVYTLMHGRMAGELFARMPVELAGWARVIAGNAVVLFAAIVSWKVFESRVLRLKARWAPREATVK